LSSSRGVVPVAKMHGQQTRQKKSPLTAPSADFLGLSSRLRSERVIFVDKEGADQALKAGRASWRLVEGLFEDAKEARRVLRWRL